MRGGGSGRDDCITESQMEEVVQASQVLSVRMLGLVEAPDVVLVPAQSCVWVSAALHGSVSRPGDRDTNQGVETLVVIECVHEMFSSRGSQFVSLALAVGFHLDREMNRVWVLR